MAVVESAVSSVSTVAASRLDSIGENDTAVPAGAVRPSVVPQTGLDIRLASRQGTHTTFTSGYAPTFVQASPVIIPSRYAEDFRRLCARNPVPCPLLAESASVGSFDALKSCVDGIADDSIALNLDIRRDTPRYRVYQDGLMVKKGVTDIVKEWTEDHVAFLIGCSYSFETALAAAGLPVRHVVMNTNCPMYRSNIPLNPAGVFTNATYVVSMRPYRRDEIQRVREVTRPYVPTHGEPIAWGWDAVKRLGVNIDRPEWGDPPLTADGKPLSKMEGDEDNVPVFWGCGVSPQHAIEVAGLKGTFMVHDPGHILVLDLRDWDLVKTS